MEKSSVVVLSTEQLDLFSKGTLPAEVSQKYGISTLKELKGVIDSGEFEVEAKPITGG